MCLSSGVLPAINPDYHKRKTKGMEVGRGKDRQEEQMIFITHLLRFSSGDPLNTHPSPIFSSRVRSLCSGSCYILSGLMHHVHS